MRAFLFAGGTSVFRPPPCSERDARPRAPARQKNPFSQDFRRRADRPRRAGAFRFPPTSRSVSGQTRSRSPRSEEHTSELQSLMRISYAVFCLKKKQKKEINEQNKSMIKQISKHIRTH